VGKLHETLLHIGTAHNLSNSAFGLGQLYAVCRNRQPKAYSPGNNR